MKSGKVLRDGLYRIPNPPKCQPFFNFSLQIGKYRSLGNIYYLHAQHVSLLRILSQNLLSHVKSQDFDFCQKILV